MSSLLKAIDRQLNKFTMYRVVLYGLMVLLAVADVLAFAGKISIGPVGLLVSIGLLCVSTYAINYAFAAIVRAPRNTESWLITALILACILPPTNDLNRGLLVLLAGALAMATKYVIKWRGTLVFNPVAAAAFILSVTSVLPAIWWVATPWLTPFTVVLALIVLRKQRKFSLFFAFALPAVALSLFISVGLHSTPLGQALQNALISTPLIFMGSIMLTEPSTLPPTRYYQLLVGVLVGAVYASQLHVGHVSATPQTALIAAGLFTVLATPSFGALLRLKSITKLSPDVYDLSFEKPKGFSFQPGQYMEWTLPHKGVDMRGNRRTFSIASSPSDPEVHIGIKHYEPASSFKTALLALKPGYLIRGAHVAGSFLLPADMSRPLLFIAGGIGITPFRSMLQHVVDYGQKRDIVLLYNAAKPEDFVYKDTFASAQALGVRVEFITGRLSAEQIKQLAPDVAGRDAYISGPDAMVTGTKGLLTSLGVGGRHIHTDHFTGY